MENNKLIAYSSKIQKIILLIVWIILIVLFSFLIVLFDEMRLYLIISAIVILPIFESDIFFEFHKNPFRKVVRFRLYYKKLIFFASIKGKLSLPYLCFIREPIVIYYMQKSHPLVQLHYIILSFQFFHNLGKNAVDFRIKLKQPFDLVFHHAAETIFTGGVDHDAILPGGDHVPAGIPCDIFRKILFFFHCPFPLFNMRSY